MRKSQRTRRDFLQSAGAALTGAALSPNLFAVGKPSGPSTASRPVLRGLMIDAGRVPEPLAYCRRVIDFCADWNLNALQFRLADDQGSALRFTSVPGLLTHKNAFTGAELKSLAEYGQSRGVDLIPELESFGHTGYITRTATYAHLLDRQPGGASNFTGVIPVHPETLELFRKLYREVAAIFPSTYLHGGCDEVNWGGSALSREALRAKSRAQIWAEYLNSLHQIAQGLGKQFIVWGDFVLHKEPQILPRLDKSIIIMDWNYAENSSANLYATFLKLRANGSRGIGAPGLANYRWGARVGTEQLRNIDAYAEAYLAPADPASLGVILTNWVPSRYVQNSIWDGFAYAAVAFNQGTATAQTSAFRRFVEKHYHATWNQSWSQAFEIIYDAAPSMQSKATDSWMGLRLPVPWSTDDQLADLLREGVPQPNPFTHLRALLVELEPQVMKNLSDFQAFALSVDYLERLFWRDRIVLEHAAKATDREAAAELIQAITQRDSAMTEALTKDWDRTRFPDAAAKLEPVFDLRPKDQMLFAWKQAANYSASLAGNPDRFYQILQSAKAGRS